MTSDCASNLYWIPNCRILSVQPGVYSSPVVVHVLVIEDVIMLWCWAAKCTIADVLSHKRPPLSLTLASGVNNGGPWDGFGRVPEEWIRTPTTLRKYKCVLKLAQHSSHGNPV